MKPFEVLQRVISYAWLRGKSSSLKKPGSVIEHQPLETRQALEELKSSDIDSTKVMLDHIDGSDEYYQQKEFEKIKLDFDKTLKK